MKKGKIVLICVCSILAYVLVGLVVLADLVYPKQYITTDLKDYGNYIGNRDNDFANEFITSFFPSEIQESFTDIKYAYRAQKNDTYAFEAYLEFRIDDPAAFQTFVADNIAQNTSEFYYDARFKEYTIADKLQLSTLSLENSDGTTALHIQSANIGKILYSKETQQIIYVAIGVYDGGIVTTDFLCEYFNRFQIDPSKYHITSS